MKVVRLMFVLCLLGLATGYAVREAEARPPAGPRPARVVRVRSPRCWLPAVAVGVGPVTVYVGPPVVIVQPPVPPCGDPNCDCGCKDGEPCRRCAPARK